MNPFIKTYFQRIFATLAFVFLFSWLYAQNDNNSLKLWYQQPAKEWNEALPVGNGRLGAMVFGRVEQELIQLNEESLWAGKNIDINNPEGPKHLKEIQRFLLEGENGKAYELSDKYLLSTPPRLRSYQTLGDILIDFGEQGNYKSYKRELNLKTGIATTTYEISGVKYKREIFVSAPQNCIVVKITADKPKSINCKINLSREKDATVDCVDNNTLLMSGQITDVDDVTHGEGGFNMKFHSLLKVRHNGGTIQAAFNSLLVQNANSVTLFLTAATDYNFSKLDYDRSIDSKAICENIIGKAFNFNDKELTRQHLNEYQSLFNRVSLELNGRDMSNLPTDKRLESFKKSGDDPQLISLYFQFGRYLLMSSSRAPGILPANLQGIWNEFYNAPWSSDYHTNINLQMNYWPAEVCNLSETVLPLVNFIDHYRVPGRVTAKELYGAKGWTMHHATDIFGKTGINAGIHWGTSPLSASWLCMHLWEHYLFTGDKEFLINTAYPIMKEAAEFIQSFLIEDTNGHLVTAPSMSPENSFKLKTGEQSVLTYAPAIDIETIQAFYSACMEAARISGEDKSFIKSLEATLKKLPPVKVSERYGIVQEWIEDYEEAEPGHRHMSQLIGLYPFNLINEGTPDLFEAAKKTLTRRLTYGGGHTGWSRAWIINFYARLQEGEKAYDNVVALLQKSTLNNLFDNHPPFQIDGNFGGTAGIAEMLLQSQNEVLHLLPALPKEWSAGEVKGLVARGGFVVDIKWENGKPEGVKIYSKNGGNCTVRFGEKIIKLKTQAGKSYELKKW